MNAIKINNHKYLTDTVALKETIETGFLNLAERLYKIRQDRIWEGEYDNLEEFLMELDITAPTCSKLCSIYENWVVKGKVSIELLAGTSWSTLYLTVPRLQNESAKDVLEDVKLLTRKDIVDKSKEIKYPNCKHTNFYTLKICEDCGKSFKTYNA